MYKHGWKPTANPYLSHCLFVVQNLWTCGWQLICWLVKDDYWLWTACAKLLSINVVFDEEEEVLDDLICSFHRVLSYIICIGSITWHGHEGVRLGWWGHLHVCVCSSAGCTVFECCHHHYKSLTFHLQRAILLSHSTSANLYLWYFFS